MGLGSFCLNIISVGHSTFVIQLYSFIIQTFMMISLVFISICYINLNSIRQKSRQNLASITQRTEETQADSGIPLFIVLVTTTNTLCWLPLFITCGMVILGYQMHPDTMNTIVGVAMPLNSLLNPCLYTFGTKTFRDKLKSVMWKNHK